MKILMLILLSFFFCHNNSNWTQVIDSTIKELKTKYPGKEQPYLKNTINFFSLIDRHCKTDINKNIQLNLVKNVCVKTEKREKYTITKKISIDIYEFNSERASIKGKLFFDSLIINSKKLQTCV